MFDPSEHPDEYEQIAIEDLKVTDTVLYVSTLFGFRSDDEVHFANVRSIEVSQEWGVVQYRVHHDGEGSPTEAEEGDRIWIRRRHG